jgi:hypothetical protein
VAIFVYMKKTNKALSRSPLFYGGICPPYITDVIIQIVFDDHSYVNKKA